MEVIDIYFLWEIEVNFSIDNQQKLLNIQVIYKKNGGQFWNKNMSFQKLIFSLYIVNHSYPYTYYWASTYF